MSNGIAQYAGGRLVTWVKIDDGNRCPNFFGAGPIPDPLQAGYTYVDGDSARTPLDLKADEVAAWWQNELATGYVTTSYGIEISWSDVDRNAVNQGISLLNEAITLGTMALTDQVQGWVDRHAQPIKINGLDPTVLQLKRIAVEMGIAYHTRRGLWLQYEAQLAGGNSDFSVGEAV